MTIYDHKRIFLLQVRSNANMLLTAIINNAALYNTYMELNYGPATINEITQTELDSAGITRRDLELWLELSEQLQRWSIGDATTPSNHTYTLRRLRG